MFLTTSTHDHPIKVYRDGGKVYRQEANEEPELLTNYEAIVLSEEARHEIHAMQMEVIGSALPADTRDYLQLLLAKQWTEAASLITAKDIIEG